MSDTCMATRPARPGRRGRPPGPRPDPVERRRQLVAAAREAIARLGPDASMAAIAKAAGYAKPALYAAFEDKASLADALAAEVSDELTRRIGSVMAEDRQSPLALRGAIDAFCQFVDSEPALFRFLVQGAAGFGRSLGERRLLVSVGEQVGALIAEGLDRTGADPAPAATLGYALMGSVFMAADWWVDSRSVSRAELVDQLTWFAGSGLAAFAAGPTRPTDGIAPVG
ncbi:MAG TPA: TetR family transcriptional regulator [Acidimicrobiales bacterium]|nr:TetR family transcriptional regulator [Acidimicrobiales bacterium]